jgi:glycosyltransferase involved in cell wall biosynthesis
MIYLDVTGGCVLPLQSGIPRITRELYRLARTNLPGFTPVRWQPFRRTYTRLSRRAIALLQNPFGERSLRHRSPSDTTVPLLLGSMRDLAPPWPEAVPLHRALDAADVLLLTSLFPDNRIEYLDRLARAPGRKIAIFHDAIPLRDPNVRPWEKKRHVLALRVLGRMDLVITVTESARLDLISLWQEHDITPAETKVLRWPVPFTTVRPPFSAPPSMGKDVLYVSRLKQVKNHATLFAACELLWREGLGFTLTLVGCEDEPRESSAIRREIEALAAAGRPVSWRAQISDYELHAAYRHCAFTVFPSRREGFGLPIVESFWHGRPVICSGTEAMGEVSSGGGAIQVDVTDPVALAAAMRRLLQDETAASSLAREAYARPQRTWRDYWLELEPLLAPRGARS